MSNITDTLEEKCRAIVHNMEKQVSEPVPATFIRREMALHLDHMDTIRERQKVLKAELLERELEIDTQILNIEERIDLVPDRIERMQLINELKQVLEQTKLKTQRSLMETEFALQKLQTRLLQLWNMHDQL